MVLRKGIPVPFARDSLNKTLPSSSEAAIGVVAGTEANSAWHNAWTNQADNEINAAQRIAQAASSFPPIDWGYDRARLVAEKQSDLIAGHLFPDSALCYVDMAINLNSVCPGWDHGNGVPCAYAVGTSNDYIYRINTTARPPTVTALDLDMSNMLTSSEKAVVCNGDNLYLAYANTVSGNYHIARIDIAGDWTGLALDDRNTGWARITTSRITMCVPRYDRIGACFCNGTNTVYFGILASDNSDWDTGSGNISGLTGTVNDPAIQEVQGSWNQLHTIVRSTSGGFDMYHVVSCDVDDPTDCSYPEDPIFVETLTSGTRQFIGFRVLGSSIVTITSTGIVALKYPDSPAWSSYPFVTLEDIGLPLYSQHCPKIVQAGVGGLWVQMRVSGAGTIYGGPSTLLVAFDPGRFRPDAPLISSFPLVPRAVIPLGSSSVSVGIIHWLIFDGENLVSFEGVATTRVRVLTNPGVR